MRSGGSLFQVLEQRRLDQKALAGYLDLQESTFSNWTAGATQLTQIESVLRPLERLPYNSCDGTVRAQCRNGMEKPALLEPGQPPKKLPLEQLRV